jgi:ATP-dependent helicase/nuclease subunit B
MDAVFGRQMAESVSRLEQYARCAYAYFLKYGLELQPRQEYSFATVDMGNLYHSALEYYSKSLQQQEDMNWYTITQEQSDALLQDAILHTYQTMTKTQVLENARDLYMLQKMEKTLRQTVWALQEQVRKGSFIPTAFEVDFKEVDQVDALTYQLDEMHKMRLWGKIDRVDLCETSDKVYVKIVDYKSGNQDMDMTRLYYGLQVQLVLYMNAITEGLKSRYPAKEVEPAAMFYYHIDRPVVDAAGGQDSKDRILRELRMRGIVNADEQVIEAMHHGLEGTSDVIPVGLKKDGTPNSVSRVLKTEEIQVMEDYTRMLMETTGQKMLQGDYDCQPYQLEEMTGCDYCDYHGVCGFDRGLEGYEMRRLTKEGSTAEVIDKMKTELEIYRHRKQTGGEA